MMDTKSEDRTEDYLGHAERTGMKLLKSFVKDTEFIPGRRPFFRYRDLGVGKASNGRMRANVVESIAGMTESTGWHYHECDMQFVYIMRGEVVIEFEDGTVGHFGPGDVMFIPGGTIHNEIYLSEDKLSIEVSLPSVIGTVAVDRPAHLPDELVHLRNEP